MSDNLKAIRLLHCAVRSAFFPIVCLGMCVPVSGRDDVELRIVLPVEIVTGDDRESTAEILVESVWTNNFDKAVSPPNALQDAFVILDAAGNSVDSFIVDTKPKGDEKQLEAQKAGVVAPKQRYAQKLKIWVRALAMEPGRCYLLAQSYRLSTSTPFVPIVRDKRGLLRQRCYQQIVRIVGDDEEHCGTIFDTDESRQIGVALTLLKDSPERVEVIPTYYGDKEPGGVTRLYEGPRLKGSVRRHKSGVAIVEFPLKAGFVELSPKPLFLAPKNYQYKGDTFLACGWSRDLGVTAPCASIHGAVQNGFSTVYATPREGWRGSGCFSNSGYLVGICDSRANPEGHSSRLGFYADVGIIRTALDELGYKFTSAGAEKN